MEAGAFFTPENADEIIRRISMAIDLDDELPASSRFFYGHAAAGEFPGPLGIAPFIPRVLSARFRQRHEFSSGS